MSLKRRFAQQDEVGRFGGYEVTGPTRLLSRLLTTRRDALSKADARVGASAPSADRRVFRLRP